MKFIVLKGIPVTLLDILESIWSTKEISDAERCSYVCLDTFGFDGAHPELRAVRARRPDLGTLRTADDDLGAGGDQEEFWLLRKGPPAAMTPRTAVR